jgi:chaperonin cofactor prefoldin
LQNIKVAELAKTEVSKLSPDKSVYHNIGRVFVFRKQDEEIADQNRDIEQYKQKISEGTKQREYLQKVIDI